MLVKAEIQSIDYNGNTCVIRIPVFESAAGGDKAVIPAIISNTPGVYNGYKEGDVVLVAFENGQIQSPVVIGKLYLGAAEETKTARGAINCASLISKTTNSLPATTKITYEHTKLLVEGAPSKYNTIEEMIKIINTQDLLIKDLTRRVEELEKK